MKKFISVILFSVSLSIATKAQVNYVILANGDSLTGKVKLINDERLDRVTIESAVKKNTFTALQVRRVSINGDTYKPVKYDESFKLMRLLKKGYLSLYAYRPAGVQTWDGLYLNKMDGNGMDVPNLAFKKYMASFLLECPEMKRSVEAGELGKSDINDIVDKYNICIELLNERKYPVEQEIAFDIEKSTAVKNFVSKITAENFDSKKDVLSILNDILAKVNKNEAIPNYLTEALKSNLSSTSHSKDLEDLLSILKK